MTERRVAECRSCGAPIVWTLTRKGKKMPVDAEPVSSGRFALVERDGDTEPGADFIGTQPYTGDRYSSHFETCPNAAQHSKKGRS